MGGKIQQVTSFISPDSKYGLLRSAAPDHSVWLYARIPWTSPLLDGANNGKRMEVTQQTVNFFDGLAGMVTPAGMKYRYLNQGQYREFHILTGAMPVRYKPPASMRGSDLGRWLNEAYGGYTVQKQCAFVGVKLNPGGNLTGEQRKADMITKTLTGLDRLAYNIYEGVPMFAEFLPDAHQITQHMLSAGFQPFNLMEPDEMAECVSQMRSWWVSQGNAEDLPVLAEGDHLHLFPNTERAASAKQKYDDNIDCSMWNIDGEFPATICMAKSSTFERTPVDQASSQWIARLMQVSTAGGANTVGVSVRGRVEPASITADQIRRNKNTIEDTIRDRAKRNREATGEMEDIRERLEYKQALYRTPDMPPTLIDLSVCALVAGNKQQALDALGVIPYVDFAAMNTAREQLFGFKSMQVCSPLRVTPFELQWSAMSIAGAGINSFDRAGDSQGALLGLGEANRQPVYLGTTTAQDEDRAPALAIVGGTGSGKTMVMLSLLFQWALIDGRDGKGKTPCVMIDPKENSDFSQPFAARHGDIYSMDSDVANGTFDPCCVLQNLEEAKEMAAIMLADILSPGGSDPTMELSVTAMLDYGLKHGAKCCGVAIELAYRAYKQAQAAGKKIPGLDERTEIVHEQVMNAVRTNQFLRIIVGTNQNVKPLKISNGLTLIKAGARSLVPAEGSENTVNGRIQRWVLRMTVLGAGAAVRKRDGIVALDEAWVALGEGSGTVVQQWMRLARSQRFMPVLASQKVKEFREAGLEGGFSRALILSMEDPDERDGTESPARAALRLLSMSDADSRIIHRMPIKPNREGNNGPNFESLQRLRIKNPRTGQEETIRGSVAYFKDASNSPVPVEIVIPPKLLSEISTTATDEIRRKQQNAQ